MNEENEPEARQRRSVGLLDLPNDIISIFSLFDLHRVRLAFTSVCRA